MALEVANTIRQQLNSIDRRALFAWGAHQFAGSDATDNGLPFLQFQVKNNPKVKGTARVKISLNGKDLYNIEVFKVDSKYNIKYIKQLEDVFAEDLVSVIDEILG